MSRGGPVRGVDTKVLSEFFRYYRFKHGLHVRDMAKLIGMSKSTYAEVECGKRKRISTDTFYKIWAWMIQGR